MRLRQLAGIGERKARETVVSRLPVDFDRFYEARVPSDPTVEPAAIAQNTATLRSCLDESTRSEYRTRTREAAEGAPTFLNRTLRIADGTDVNWYDDRFDDLPIDWQLKLYAFQPLAWFYSGFDENADNISELSAIFDGWIQDWIESSQIGRPRYLRRTWTPWAVSLRILHFSRYLAREKRDDNGGFERSLRQEIYKNVLFLCNHIERDIGGNHLIENGAALVVAGVLFGNRSWVDTGNAILVETGTRQYLNDGCHSERSPMYHILTLTRYLTVCHLLELSNQSVPDELRTVTKEATAFLQYLRPPDGRMPLLNDAVYDQALRLDECLRYADKIGIGNDGGTKEQTVLSRDTQKKQSSGYHWLRNDAGGMLVDGGHVGPPHLPGHSHSDTLNILLWLDNQAVVTDTGTFGYTNDSYRQYARGVKGHNTVQVGDKEPIALDGKYLMGPRPEPSTRVETGSVSLFEGRYKALPYGEKSYVHHRSVYTGDEWWTVWDTVSDHGDSSVRGRLHLHPDIDPSLESTDRVRLEIGSGDSVAFLHPLGNTRFSVTSGWYFPKFGAATNRPVLIVHPGDADTKMTNMGFSITRENVDKVAVQTVSDNSLPVNLSIAGTGYRLPRRQLSVSGEQNE